MSTSSQHLNHGKYWYLKPCLYSDVALAFGWNHARYVLIATFCCYEGGDAPTNIPTVTGGPHNKIANGSKLIEINCTATQGRFLKVSFDKKNANYVKD